MFLFIFIFSSILFLFIRHEVDILMKRISKGVYFIGEEKLNYVRLVRHLILVRVGGGWESLLQTAGRMVPYKSPN